MHVMFVNMHAFLRTLDNFLLIILANYGKMLILAIKKLKNLKKSVKNICGSLDIE